MIGLQAENSANETRVLKLFCKDTRAPLRMRPTPPATLAQGKEECN